MSFYVQTYESMAKAQHPASVIAQRIAIDLQVKYTDPSVLAVANAVFDRTEVPIEHLRALQVYAKTKYERMRQRMPEKKVKDVQVQERFIRQYKEQVAKNENAAVSPYSGEFAVKKASETDTDRTVSLQTESTRKELSAERALQLKNEAQEATQKIILSITSTKKSEEKNDSSSTTSEKSDDGASIELSDTQETENDTEDAGNLEDIDYESPMGSTTGKSTAKMSEVSAEKTFPAPPVISQSRATFTPYNSKSDKQRFTNVCVHIPERLYTCENIISSMDCKDLILLLNFTSKEEKSQEILLTQIKELEFPIFRTSMKRKYINESLAQCLLPIFQQILPEKLSDGRRFVGVRSAMNFFRYGPGDFFATHLDGGYSSTETGHSSEYTFILYLNDDFEGGSTRFCGIPEWEGGARDVKPSEGGISIFRQSDMKHCGVTLKSGLKYIIQGMVMYSQLTTSKLGRPIPKKANTFLQVDC